MKLTTIPTVAELKQMAERVNAAKHTPQLVLALQQAALSGGCKITVSLLTYIEEQHLLTKGFKVDTDPATRNKVISW